MIVSLALAVVAIFLSGAMAYALDAGAAGSDPQGFSWYELGKLGALVIVLGIATRVLWSAYREANEKMIGLIGTQATLMAEVRDAMRDLAKTIQKCERKEK